MILVKHFTTKLSALMVILIMVSSHAQAMQSPQEVVEQTVNTMVAKLDANRAIYEADSQALYDMLDATLLPALHVPRMADLILGKNVANASTAEQKKAFADEFQTFLLQTYASGLLNATGKEKVIYEPVELAKGDDKVKIKAKLISASGAAFPIILSMSNRSDTRWRAYNLEVAGINFIRTYRASFAQTLNEKGIDGLISDLRGKNAR